MVPTITNIKNFTLSWTFWLFNYISTIYDVTPNCWIFRRQFARYFHHNIIIVICWKFWRNCLNFHPFKQRHCIVGYKHCIFIKNAKLSSIICYFWLSVIFIELNLQQIIKMSLVLSYYTIIINYKNNVNMNVEISCQMW